MHLPPTCGVRQLSKLKRFLTTLQQFGSDISPDIGERVRGLIVNLVVSRYYNANLFLQMQATSKLPSNEGFQLDPYVKNLPGILLK